jgi:two-component sensor histidine kinase
LVSRFKDVAVDQSHNDFYLYNVKEYIDKVLFSLQSLFNNTDYKLRLNCRDGIKLWGDPEDITQIMTSLVKNSLIHGFENDNEGSIEITTKKSMPSICL